jgi:transketolase
MAAFTATDTLGVNTLRTLAMDAVQKANSGHPGAPMGLAPLAYVLWQRHMNYDPASPLWMNRDRFVLSNGHASMLLYGTLFLAGVGPSGGKKAVTLDEIMRFRQLDSITAGHPESHLVSGVETTTGPLGQGIGNAVGMAIAGQWLKARYSKPGYDSLFDHTIYTICGDGCLMEGVASEACSLAGHLKLGNLVLLYDDNNITIDGNTKLAFTEDVGMRFEAYGWRVLRVADVTDLGAVDAVLTAAKQSDGRPTLVCVKTVIGHGSPKKAGSEKAHGEPLGDDEIKATKAALGWPTDAAPFHVPAEVLQAFKIEFAARGAAAHKAWAAKFAEYAKAFPAEAEQLQQIQARKLPAGWDKELTAYPTDAKGMATRASSGKALNALAKNLPWLIGGSADLAKSNVTPLTFPEAGGDFQAATPAGRTINFGVREHAMGAICNGISLTGLRPFAAGFLIFSDYGRPSIRLAALMEIPVLYIFTHDSIGVGEDGPTHQPIEQLASLRAIPNVTVLRPGDANEVNEAYRIAAENTHGPTILALSRQPVPTFDRTKYGPASGVANGGYVFADCSGTPEVLLIATGTELPLAVEAHEQLSTAGVRSRVVSLPSWELFEKQSQAYRDSVIPPSITARVCIEMGSAFGWERYAGPKGSIVAMRSFGASAPLKDLLTKFGFTTAAVVAAAKAAIEAK